MISRPESSTYLSEFLQSTNWDSTYLFVSRLAEDSLAATVDLLIPQVWSVPFISMTRRLDIVEVSNDEQLITIKEDEGAINIYIREEISPFDQPRINFELLEYFSSLFKIDAKHTNLVNYLMGAPISELPAIMERYDLTIPEDSDNGSSDDQSSDGEHNATTAAHRTAAQGGADLGIEPSPDSVGGGHFRELERRFRNLQISSEADDQDAALVTPPRSPHLQPLQELIPSHLERTESIVQRASHFQMSESLVAMPPIHNPQSDVASSQSLPTRTRDNPSGGGGLASPGRPIPGVSVHETFTVRHTTEVSRSHLRSYEVAPSPYQVPRRSQDGSLPMRDVRYREIGFLGELFVNPPLCSSI